MKSAFRRFTVWTLVSVLIFPLLLFTNPASAAAADQTNLITNPSFEGGLEGWYNALEGGYDGELTISGDAYEGSYSAKITGVTAVAQELEGLSPNTRYTLSAMTKTTSLDAFVALVVEYGGGEVTVEPESTAYGMLSLDFETGEDTEAVIYGLIWDESGESAAYFDDFKLVNNEPVTKIPVESIAVSTVFGPVAITEKGGKRQMSVSVSPEDAENRMVTWAVYNEDGTETENAVISKYGLLPAVGNGVVKAVATANDGSEVYGEALVTISGQEGPAPEEPEPVVFDYNTEWKGVVWGPYDDDYFSAEVAKDLNDMRDAGIKWVRFWFSEDIDTDWNDMDEFVRLCNEKGLHIIACYNKTNPWNSLGDGEELREEAELLTAAAERYKEYIHHWEIHNEPNLPSYWNTDDIDWSETEYGEEPDEETVYDIGAARFVQWLKLAHDTIKAEDPDAIVILGGLSEWGMEEFMDKLTEKEAYLYFDEVAFHPYAGNHNPVPEQVVSRLNAFQDKMSEWPAPHNDKPIWITEVGFHVDDIADSYPGTVPDKNGQPDEETKAQYLYETMVSLINNLEYPRPISWYSYYEYEDGKSGYGLVKKYESGNDTITVYNPAYYRYKSMDKAWDEY